MTTKLTPYQEARERLRKALPPASEALSEACQNGFELRASIPGRETDHDVVLGEVINAARALLDAEPPDATAGLRELRGWAASWCLQTDDEKIRVSMRSVLNHIDAIMRPVLNRIDAILARQPQPDPTPEDRDANAEDLPDEDVICPACAHHFHAVSLASRFEVERLTRDLGTLNDMRQRWNELVAEGDDARAALRTAIDCLNTYQEAWAKHGWRSLEQVAKDFEQAYAAAHLFLAARASEDHK